MTDPANLPRRSPLYREHLGLGAVHMPLGEGAYVESYGDVEAEVARTRALGLCDLSMLPRLGWKGWNALAWAAENGLPVPEANNRAVATTGGGFVARLADTELLVAAGPGGEIPTVAGATPEGIYAVPRFDGSARLLLTGGEAPDCMAKLCAVDLRPGKFAAGAVAQTSIARLSAVLVRHDLGDIFALHLLFDRASAAYLWGVLTDAMGEYRGGPVGLSALRRLGNAS